jgi:hypothetical protein
MKIYARLSSFDINSTTTLGATCSISFNNGGTLVNTSGAFDVTIPNIITAELICQAFAKGVSDYVNSNYSLSTAATDVIFPTGLGVPPL